MRAHLLTLIAVVAVGTASGTATQANASAPPTASRATATASRATATAAAPDPDGLWKPVFRHNFTDLHALTVFQSSVQANNALQPGDAEVVNQSLMQKPVVPADVGVVVDPAADDGAALAVQTRQAGYATSAGTANGWTNGRVQLTGQDQSPPFRVRARVRFTPSVGTKTAVMWWPAKGWPWEVDFAETFGGTSLTDYWGSRQHVSERWHGDGPDAGLKANEQIAHNIHLDATAYHVYDLFVTPARMWVEVDGVLQFQTSDPQFIPTGPGSFSVGKALTGVRGDTTRTEDTVFVDWLEIDRPDLPPAVPQGLGGTGSATGIRLSWAADPDTDVAGYNVYRAAPNGTYTKLNTPGLVLGTAYADPDAPTGATSGYTVTAVDRAGNESAPSAPIAVARPDQVAPRVPAGLAGSGSAAGIALTWGADDDADLAGYNVYRAGVDGTYARVNTDGVVSGTSYADPAAPTGATSSYSVTAVDTAGNESARSGAARVSRPFGTTEQAGAAFTGRWGTRIAAGFSGGSTASSTVPGSRAVFRFNGRQVRWLTSTGPRGGTATVWYDGVRKAHVDLYSATRVRQVVGFSSPIRAGDHTLVVRVDAERVDVDAFLTAS